MNRRTKTLATLGALAIAATVLTGCTQADRVSYNISKDADNFNVDRRLVVINTITDTPLFEIVGRFSIEPDATGNKLDITVKEDEDSYKKHFVGLDAATVVYIVEDITDGGTNVNPYRYQISYLPESIIPIEFKDGSE